MEIFIIIFISFFAIVQSRSVLDHLLSVPECHYCIQGSCKPTVVPFKSFNATKDRMELHNAFAGKPPMQGTLIDILTKRSDPQRLQIGKDYIRIGTTLPDDIAETSGKTMGLLQALATPLPIFYAQELHKAVTSSNYKILIEMLSSFPGCAIREISVIYRAMFGASLYKQLGENTWFHFKELLLSLATGDRDENVHMNYEQIKEDSRALSTSGVEAWLVDHGVFINVFTKRSFHQLRYTISAYDKLRKAQDRSYDSILQDIGRLFKDEVQLTYSSIVSNVLDQKEFFAKELESALTEFVTSKDSSTITRIIRGRCEIDLQSIKNKYKDIYGKTLANRVRETTSDEYQAILLNLLKE